MNCGRIRKPIQDGWNQLTDHELQNQKVALLSLSVGDQYTLSTQDNEYSLVILEGALSFSVQSGLEGTLGPRRNVFEDLPEGLLLTREEEVRLTAGHALPSRHSLRPRPSEISELLDEERRHPRQRTGAQTTGDAQCAKSSGTTTPRVTSCSPVRRLPIRATGAPCLPIVTSSSKKARKCPTKKATCSSSPIPRALA